MTRNNNNVPFNKIKNHVWYTKWLASILTVMSILATTADREPYNAVLGLVGSLLWLYVSIRWNDRSLIVLNSVALAAWATAFI